MRVIIKPFYYDGQHMCIFVLYNNTVFAITVSVCAFTLAGDSDWGLLATTAGSPLLVYRWHRASRMLAESPGRAPGGPRRAPVGFRGGFRGPSRELWEQWDDLGKVPGGAEEAMSDLSLRFPVFGGHRTLWAYVFQCFGALGRSRLTPVQ